MQYSESHLNVQLRSKIVVGMSGLICTKAELFSAMDNNLVNIQCKRIIRLVQVCAYITHYTLYGRGGCP